MGLAEFPLTRVDMITENSSTFPSLSLIGKPFAFVSFSLTVLPYSAVILKDVDNTSRLNTLLLSIFKSSGKSISITGGMGLDTSHIIFFDSDQSLSLVAWSTACACTDTVPSSACASVSDICKYQFPLSSTWACCTITLPAVLNFTFTVAFGSL